MITYLTAVLEIPGLNPGNDIHSFRLCFELVHINDRTQFVVCCRGSTRLPHPVPSLPSYPLPSLLSFPFRSSSAVIPSVLSQPSPPLHILNSPPTLTPLLPSPPIPFPFPPLPFLFSFPFISPFITSPPFFPSLRLEVGSLKYC